ncbi:TauD/TfdA family dioxygenase [Metapseudomonas otitidis]|uniref:TauD/TfdA family dioxygenase n=1 Tax=Metapseudomonas otitidis TaxID=319939 RepID=UPI001CA39F6C|nr:TauD/TfdA family dioxygenase [Pseudomonas otitidis]QZX80816.1 TauD/TfdA family dioxygenase [Pseudomonas otitidis]
MQQQKRANTYTLTDTEKERLEGKLRTITYDTSGGQEYLNQTRNALLQTLPSRVLDAFFKQRASLEPSAFIIIENVPTDESVFFTPDPNIYTPSAKTGHISENLLCGIGTLVGEPYSMKFEGKEIVNNLIPTSDTAKEYTGLGSDVELDFHIENAALKFQSNGNYSPLGLILTGVRHDNSGPMTRVADARQALQTLCSDDIETLRSALFRIKLPYRWRSYLNTSIETDPVPVLSGRVDLPDVSVVFYPGMISAINKEAERSLQNFYSAIKSVAIGIDIKPGKLIYIDNRIALHSRDSFQPSLDENGTPYRWVQRVFVATNLWLHRELKPFKHRVFDISRSEQ